MKQLKKAGKWVLVILSFIVVASYIFDYDYILKGIRVVYFTGHTTAFIEDTPYFDTHTISTSASKKWKLHKKYNQIPATKKLDAIHQELGTVAYLIVKNDSIFHEYYAEGFSKTSQTNSFSMAKSVTSALLFRAIAAGYIKSLDTPVAHFIPELQGQYASQLTVGDLSSMASGLNWTESYSSPFSITAKANYDSNIRPLITTLEVTAPPGKSFKYLSGATQLLGIVIERASKKTLATYLSESFWQPLGMSQNALWQLDSNESGMEKAFCCIASNARDFSRFGQLWLYNGAFNNRQLIPEKLAIKAQLPRFESSPQYGYGLWLTTYKGKKITYMRGILGQYVICIPEDNIIITRLGHRRSAIKASRAGDDFSTYIDEAYNMLNRL